MENHEDGKVSLELYESDHDNEIGSECGGSNEIVVNVSEQSPDLNSLETIDFDDFTSTDGSEYDWNSFDEDSDTDINSFIIEESITLEEKIGNDQNVADNIITFFKVKRPVRFIDKDTIEDEVSYEESETRLTILLCSLSILLLIISSILATILGFQVFQTDNKQPWENISENDALKLSYPTFNFVLMDYLGNLEIHQLINQKALKLIYRLKLPKTGSYFLFADRGEVYVIKGKGNKPHSKNKEMKITKISTNGNHRTIPNSEMPATLQQEISGSFRMGNLFWVFASQQNEAYANFGNLLGYESTNGKSFLWSIRKQKWFRVVSPLSYDKTLWWNGPCGMSINRTFGLIISKVDQDNFPGVMDPTAVLDPEDGYITPGCVGYQLVDYATSNITINDCFHLLKDFIQAEEVSCTSLIAKDGSMLVVKDT